jgi:hypothetical protein
MLPRDKVDFFLFEFVVDPSNMIWIVDACEGAIG